MSGVISSIGKVFKAVVIRPITHPFDIGGNISGAFHAVKESVVAAWHNPLIRYAAIAVAAYFTAGAAMAYFSPAAAAGGAAAGASVAGATGLDATVGLAAAGTTTAASTAAAGFGGLATFGAADTAAMGYGALAADAATVGAGATLTGAAAGSIAAGGSLAAFSGQAVGAQALASGANASTISQSVGLSSMPAGTSDAALTQVSQAAGNPSQYGMMLQDTGATSGGVTAGGPGSILTDSSGFGQSNLGAGLGTPASGSAGSGFNLANTAPAGSDLSASTQTSFLGHVENGVSNLWSDVKTGVGKLFGGGAPASATAGAPGIAAPAAGGGMLGEMGKAVLIQGGLQMASALLTKPQAQMQYAGVNSKGQGAGLGIHTINSGFGLATGGSEPSPEGVPSNLKMGAGAMTAGAYTGSQLSNAAIAGGGGVSGTAGNLGQTVANSAGIGGLVPQGAVNYMGNPNG